MGRTLIAYYRVSTAKQGSSGLGLEGQEAAVRAYANATGGTIVRCYREVESGKKNDRPELAKALADCRRSKAILCIAKLDRLSRNVAFLAGLMESKSEFIACDNPSATPLTLHILAAVAEDEAKRIRERTIAALAAAKARGVKLGSHRPGANRLKGGANAEASRRAGEVAKANAAAAYIDVAEKVGQLRAGGASLADIARTLTMDGLTTRRGRPWNKVQVKRLLDRN